MQNTENRVPRTEYQNGQNWWSFPDLFFQFIIEVAQDLQVAFFPVGKPLVKSFFVGIGCCFGLFGIDVNGLFLKNQWLLKWPQLQSRLRRSSASDLQS